MPLIYPGSAQESKIKLMTSHTIQLMHPHQVSKSQLSRFITFRRRSNIQRRPLSIQILWEKRQAFNRSIPALFRTMSWSSSARCVASQSLTTKSPILCQVKPSKLRSKNLHRKRYILKKHARAVTNLQSKRSISIKTLLDSTQTLGVRLACKGMKMR